MKKLLVIVSLLFLGFFAKSQELLVPLNDDYEMEVQTAAYSSDYLFHTAMRGWSYSQFDGIINLDSINELYRIKINKKGKFANYILNSILNDDFIRLKDDNYYVAINPYIDFELGSDGHRTTWVNTRGAEIKGTIGKQFAFYTNIKENQAVFPEYIDDYCTTIGVVPGQGFANRFKENGRDFTNASAYIAYRPAKWFDATLGYGKNFIGDGYRSMMLSDNAANYPYLKLKAEFWRIQYTCMYAQLTDRHTIMADNTYARKWAVMHYLDFAITKRWNIGFFDAVMAAAQTHQQVMVNDSTYTTIDMKRGFDFQYINPIIFLRSAEYYAGSSPDNAMLGINMSYIIGKHTTIYGQFVLDEMTFHRFIEMKGYRHNKQAYQLGVKSYDCFGVKNLFLQLEGNIVRPYMYSHTTQEAGISIGENNYAHYNEPLAHPWGANLWEMVFRGQYNWNRYYFQYKLNYGQYGDDWDVENNVWANYGHNVYNDYKTAIDLDFDENGNPTQDGHYLLTGRKTTVMMNDLIVSYLVNPSYNLNVFAEVAHRHFAAETLETQNDFIFSFGIRTSLDRKYYDF
ncbi:MAG: hypothetical protein J6P64_06180 [Bacteroidales bacterium]|nr:hypothetical protein [Bacteroidales bacterium]